MWGQPVSQTQPAGASVGGKSGGCPGPLAAEQVELLEPKAGCTREQRREGVGEEEGESSGGGEGEWCDYVWIMPGSSCEPTG